MVHGEFGISEAASARWARPVTFAILACGSRGEGFARWIEENPGQGTVVAVADPTAVAAVEESALETELDDTPETPEGATPPMGLKRRGNTGTARRPRSGAA